MDQGINSLLTGLTDSINKYMGVNIQSQIQAKAAEAEYQRGMQMEQHKSSLDLAKDSALEAYKLTLAGEIDGETAKAMHPKFASVVEAYHKKNGRYPTPEVATKLFKESGEQDSRSREISDRQNQNFIKQHANKLADDQIPGLLGAYNELASEFEKGSLSGVGVTDTYIANIFTGEQGIRNRTNLQQIANLLLKQRSGAAVTDQEYARFLKELQGGRLPDEKSIKVHIGKIGKDMKSLVALRESGLNKDALNEYYSRPGSVRSSDVKEIKFDAPKGQSSGGWSYVGPAENK